MFKHIRPLAAMTLGVFLALNASCALAAPKVKVTGPKKDVPGGEDFEITVNTDTPGFASVTLSSSDGLTTVTLFDAKEVHTKDNEIGALAVDEAGEPLPVGGYTVTVTVVDQFGEVSAEATAEMTVAEPKVKATPTPAPADSGSASGTSSSTETAKPTVAATPIPVTEEVTYQAGSGVVGAEGYEIGVGVSDSAATAKGAWAITSSSTDAEIWAAMTAQMTAVNVGESENAYIYDSVEDGRKRLGTVSGTSQGLNVVAELDNGWSLVEAFRIEDGAFVRGYIRSNKLRTTDPNTTYGLLIDKATQTLTVYKDGVRIGSCAVCTGLPTPKYLHRETPAGEFITVTRRGTTEYYGNGYSKYTIRVNGSYHLSEIPTTKKNGSDFSKLESSLGQKATRGNICIAHDASTDGGINAEWIWNMTDENKRVKVIILDDKARDQVPVSAN